MREADRVLGAVVQLIQESAGEARAQGRRTLYLMHQADPEEFERALKRQCTDAHQRKCREVLEKIKSCGDPLLLGAKKTSSPQIKVHCFDGSLVIFINYFSGFTDTKSLSVYAINTFASCSFKPSR